MSIAYYDQNARPFFDDTAAARVDDLHTRVLAHVPTGGRILDAGCGSGRDALAFHKAGYEVEAFDGSAAMVALAREHTGLAVRQMRFEEVDGPDAFGGGFDLVWASASLLHVPRAELTATAARLVGLLNPGGVLFASFKQGETEREKNGRRFTDMTEPMLRAVFEALGLKVLDLWGGADARPGREGERWVSAVGLTGGDPRSPLS